MTPPGLAEGAFVRAFFPTRERPREPGLLHVCYVLAVRRPLALVAYTTTRPLPEGVPVPFGVVAFGAREAEGLNQRPFTLHLNRQARLPLTPAWFPDIERAGAGVVAVAPEALRERLFRVVVELERRHRETVARGGV